jgi:thiosulfate/3-mercaptopyruvate sulfurtransferase
MGPGQTAGRIAAARVAVILMYAGMNDVRLLDGGFEAWVQDGFRIQTGMLQPVPAESFGTAVPAKPEILIDLEETKALVKDPDSQIVSMRTWKEFIGETSGYSYIQAKGRIAGSLWGQSGHDANQMENFGNIDQTMLNYENIKMRWERSGIKPDKRVVFYCGTGWRASIGFMCAHLMGWEKISVYDGGWNEWSQDESNPVQSGKPIEKP